MNRLVGEMKLEKRADGYYISYYLDRGKAGRKSDVQQDQPEKNSPGPDTDQLQREWRK